MAEGVTAYDFVPEWLKIDSDPNERWFWLRYADNTARYNSVACLDRHLNNGVVVGWYVSTGNPDWRYQKGDPLFDTMEDAAKYAIAMHLTGEIK